MQLVRRHLPSDDDPSSYSASVQAVQTTTDGFSSSSVSMSTAIVYSDPSPSPTTYAVDSTPTTTAYDILPSSSTYSPSSDIRDGPAAVSETTSFYLGTSYSLSPLPTTAPVDATTTSTNQTALLAALTAGISALVLLLLVAFLLCRRHRRLRRQSQHSHIGSRALPQSALLQDDEMARDAHIRMVPATTSPYNVQNSVMPDSGPSIYRPPSPSPSILRSRISESGSIFREEVWPPPSPVVDPIQMRSSQVDLSGIVDDVMGPSPDKSDGNPLPTRRKTHKRENSTTPLLIERQTSSGHDSSEEDFGQMYTSPSSDSPTSPMSPPVFGQSDYGFVQEAFPPILNPDYNLRHSWSSVSSISSSSHSAASPVNMYSPSSFRPPSRGSVQGSISSSTYHRTQPKVSSPLVRALTGFGGNNR